MKPEVESAGSRRRLATVLLPVDIYGDPSSLLVLRKHSSSISHHLRFIDNFSCAKKDRM